MTSFAKRLLIFFATCLPIIIALLIFNIILKQNIEKVAEAAQQNKNILLAQQNIFDALIKLQRDKEFASQYIDIVENIFPQKDDLLSFPSFWRSLALKNKVSSNFTFTAHEIAPTENDLGYIIFSATASGPSENLMNFLETIYKSRYFIKIDSINMTGSGDRQSISMNGKVYFK